MRYFQRKKTFLLDWITLFCDVYYEFKTKKWEWENSLEELEGYHLIQLLSASTIWVEEVYLERIYNPKNRISDLTLYRTMIDCFSNNPDVFFDCPEVLFRFTNNPYYFLGVLDDKKVKLYILAKNVCEKAIIETLKNSIENVQYHKFLGISYRVLSEMDEKDQIFNAKKAIKSCVKSCRYFESSSDSSRGYAIWKSDLGTAYRHLAEVTSQANKKRIYCNKGIKACEEALQIKECPLVYHATTYTILGTLHRILGEVEYEKKNYNQVIDNCTKAKRYCKEALNIYTKNNLTIQVATTQYVLGKIYKLLAEEKKSLNVRTFRDFKIDFAKTQVILRDAYLILSKFENESNNRTNAKIAYETALNVFSNTKFPRLHDSIQSKIKKKND